MNYPNGGGIVCGRWGRPSWRGLPRRCAACAPLRPRRAPRGASDGQGTRPLRGSSRKICSFGRFGGETPRRPRVFGLLRSTGARGRRVRRSAHLEHGLCVERMQEGVAKKVRDVRRGVADPLCLLWACPRCAGSAPSGLAPSRSAPLRGRPPLRVGPPGASRGAVASSSGVRLKNGESWPQTHRSDAKTSVTLSRPVRPPEASPAADGRRAPRPPPPHIHPALKGSVPGVRPWLGTAVNSS
jgi:hypothetical protein